MRLCGLSRDEAMEGLKTMRQKTYDEVGSERIEIAESLYVSKLL